MEPFFQPNKKCSYQLKLSNSLEQYTTYIINASCHPRVLKTSASSFTKTCLATFNTNICYQRPTKHYVYYMQKLQQTALTRSQNETLSIISQILAHIANYCSIIWRPHLIKDIKMIEQLQRRVTKFILNDYDRLLKLNLLPIIHF